MLMGLSEPASAAPTDDAVYVNCAAGTPAGDGSLAHPYTSLDQVNALTLTAGDSVLFARGSTCLGALTPHGSGNATAPITIGAYGTGALPVIDGNGAHDAVLLDNIDHITVQDLDITNAANPGTERNGLRIHLQDFGKGSGYLIQRLDIHDVMGDDNKGLNGSAGIQIAISGKTTPTWFDGLQIKDNTLTHDGREGIYFKSTWNSRPEVGTQDTSGLGPWTPSTGVVISGNTLTSIAGDGIKVDTTKGAVIEHNTLAGFQLRSNANNAGIWPFNSDDTVVQYNDVSGGGSSGDGMSFDADGGSQNTIFQYNYSHDNKGGLLLVCPYSGAFTHGTIMRYNISHNDGARLFQLCPGDVRGTQIYNNTIVNDAVTPQYFLQDDNSTKRDVTWTNNIVVNTGTPLAVQNRGPVLTFDHNLLIGVADLPANGDGQTNPGGSSADPGLVDTQHIPTGIDDLTGYQLRAGSPALSAGTPVTDNGGRDFFGNPVSATSAPNMGAYQGAGIVDAAHPVAVKLADASLLTGKPTIVTAAATWWGSGASTGITAKLAAPAGWKVVAVHAIVPANLSAGQTADLSWQVTPPAGATLGDESLTVTLSRAGTSIGTATATAHVRQLYDTISDAFNDVAITADGADPYTGDMALSLSSLSSNELKKQKGIASGAQVSGANVTYTWPQFTPGEDNAVWSSGQSIALSGQGQYLGFVLFGVNAYPTPTSGTASVTYTDGTSDTFTLSAGDYYYNKPADGNVVFTTMDYRNTPSGKGNGPFSLYESTVPLDNTKTVAYVTLPDLPGKVDGKTPGLMVMAIGIGGEASTTPPDTNPDGKVSISSTDVHPGDTITFTGDGFWDAEKVSTTVHSDPIDLDAVTADAGTATANWTVPDDFALGQHEVQMRGADSGRLLSAQFTVTAADAGGTTTGGDTTGAGSTGDSTGGSTGGTGTATTGVASGSGSSLADTGTDLFGCLAAGALALLLGAGIVLGWRRRTAQ